MHIHTDFAAGMFSLIFVIVGLHSMRGLSGAMASRKIPGAGIVGGLATFN